MSRRSRASPMVVDPTPAIGNKEGSSGPPSHQIEQKEEHRAWLKRSLERNDVEIAALMELQATIQQVKQRLLRTENGGSSEELLLKIGQGKVRLAKTTGEDSLEWDEDAFETALSWSQQEEILDFLLRCKLRRRLLNRLTRRLLRVSAALDGNPSDPPALPKYGDLRLHVDEQAVQAFVQEWERQEQTKMAIQKKREEDEARFLFNDDLEQDEAGEEKGGELAMTKSGEEKPAGKEDMKPETTESSVPEAAAVVKTVAEGVPPSDTTTMKEGGEAENTFKAEEAEAFDSPASAHNILNVGSEAAIDYDALLEFNDSYEKLYMPDGTVKYTLLADEEGDKDGDKTEKYKPDYMLIGGAGIGATYRSHMSLAEKEAEYKRWQAAILQKVPFQPTFADLGLQNRVFCLEERLDRAMRQREESVKVRPMKGGISLGKTLKAKAHSPGGDAMEVDGEKNDADGSDVVEKTGGGFSGEDNDQAPVVDSENVGEEASPAKSTAEQDDQNNDEDDEKTASPRRTRPISLQPVPSFYDQDLKRMKLIHGELMASSMRDHARRKMEEVTREYNAALKTSNEAFDRRMKVQNQLHAINAEKNHYVGQVRQNITRDQRIAHERWNEQRRAFETRKLNQVFPLRADPNHRPIGSPMIRMSGNEHDPVRRSVAKSLAEVVDAVELISQGALMNPTFESSFVPPQHPDIHSDQHLRHLNQMEETCRKEIQIASANLRASEDDRQRAWKRMMKTKAEFDLPHQHMRGRVQVDMHNYHLMPLPALRQSSTQSIPQEVAPSRSSFSSYVPTRVPRARAYTQGKSSDAMHETGGSLSKYSAARVRERISSDGTVAPVTAPKRTKDGLYQRPAGRTRKGMEWDAIRGIWVPADQVVAIPSPMMG